VTCPLIGNQGGFCLPVVFDNWIVPIDRALTLAVMTDSGHKSKLPDQRGWKPTPADRSVQYDSVNADTAEFLLQEVLPTREKIYKISRNPELRAIGRNSSGRRPLDIARTGAFSVVWHRPDSFRKVLRPLGSFVDFRGAPDFTARHFTARPSRGFQPATSTHSA